MFLFNKVKVRSFEKGLLFREGEFEKLIDEGSYRFFKWSGKRYLEVVSMREPWFVHADLRHIVDSGALNGHATVIDLKETELGLVFINGRFDGILDPGLYVHWNLATKVSVEIVDTESIRFQHPKLSAVVKAGALKDRAEVVDLKDNERGLVFIDGRFDTILGPGLHALWNTGAEVSVEVMSVDGVRFQHDKLNHIVKTPGTAQYLDVTAIPAGSQGLFFRNGEFVEALPAGYYAFFRDVGRYNLFQVDCRETVADVSGQEIMTSDKVTLRINAVVTYRVEDAEKAVKTVEDFRQSLYREAQLALRGVIGTRELDVLLGHKDEITTELNRIVAKRAAVFGLKVVGFGIKDIILPGEMKELLNQVTQAKKAAEAAVITRREETAAMRSQANTAKILESNPVLMRLKELETLEKVAKSSKLNVVLGDKGLTDRLVNLI